MFDHLPTHPMRALAIASAAGILCACGGGAGAATADPDFFAEAAGAASSRPPGIAPIGARVDRYLDVPASARGPAVDPAKGYRLQELGRGLYMVTDNAYQSMCMVHDGGVIARETARRAIRDADRAAAVISRVRALLARKPPAMEPVELNDATREVVALTRSELQRARAAARLELAPDLPLVRGDRIQLQQVMVNLVRNALEAVGEVEGRPREIVVRTARGDDGRVWMSVRDSGVGFAPADAERLFDAFHTTKPDGMGIGLSVSRSIVECHGGRLRAVPNDDGPGATFAFSVPRWTGGGAGAAR